MRSNGLARVSQWDGEYQGAGAAGQVKGVDIRVACVVAGRSYVYDTFVEADGPRANVGRTRLPSETR